MADVKWIKLSTTFADSKKIKQIRKLPQGDTIALMWVFLICLAGDTNEEGMVYFTPEIPYTEEMLADQFDMEINTVRLGLTTFRKFGMIEIVDDIICLSSWEKWQSTDSLATIREQTRKRVARHRERQKLLACNVTSNVTVTQCNATEEEIEEDIEIDKDIEKDKNTNCAFDNAHCASSAPTERKISKAEVNDFFESIWKLYPNKKGKGQISDSKKLALYKIGPEELKRAIERYKADLEKEEWRKPQNGSTFFNSGYVDYLDANYEPTKARPQQKKTSFHNFHQRSYEGVDLERMLLNSQNPPKTAGEDEGIRARAEALKRELGGA